MRHFTELPAPQEEKTTKKKTLLAKARAQKADEATLSEFATLADQLGFQSEQISVLKRRSSDIAIARDALLKARKPDRYKYNKSDLESHIEQILRLFATAKPLLVELSRPSLVSDGLGASAVRCGFPDEKVHAYDSQSLFITNLYAEREEQGKSITSFFVRRSVYFAFFSRSAEIEAYLRSSLAPTPNSSAAQTRSSPFQEAHTTPTPEARGRYLGERPATFEGRRLEVEEEREGQVLEGNGRDQRRDTEVDIERIIAGGLASIREDPDGQSHEAQAAGNLEELGDSYQDFIRTGNVVPASDNQPEEQNLDRRLQIIAPPPPEVRIEFKILGGDI